MPAQDTMLLGYNLPEFNKQTQEVLDRLTAIKVAAKEVDGTIINLSNFSGGVKDFKKGADDSAKALGNLSKETEGYNKVVLQQIKIKEAEAKANKESSTSFTKNTQDVEDNVIAQKELRDELEKNILTQKKLNEFKAASNFKNNPEAEIQIEKELIALSERELEIKKQLAQENSKLTNNPTSAAQPAATQDARAIALERESRRQLNAETKSSIQLELAEAGSITEARAQIALLTQERNKLNLTTAEGIKRQTELNKKIDEQNAFIKSNVDRQQAQRLNIGNYPTQGISVLSKELTNIQSKLSNMKAGDTGFEKLAQQEKLLISLSETLDKQFTTTRQEMLALRNVTQALGSEFGVTSEQFRNFVSIAGERQDEIKDIQDTINFASSDTKYIDGILNGVNGLVSAYGAAAAAQQLFGDNTEESAEQMQKMQTILTLVVSVQQIVNTLQTESGTIQTVLAGKTALLNAASKLNAIISGETAAARHAEIISAEELAVAEGEAAAAKEAQILAEREAAILSIQSTGLAEAEAVALYEESVAADALAVSMTAEAEAAAAAAAATKAFLATLTAAGIVTLIAAIGAAFILSSKSAKDFTGEAANAQKRLKDYGETADEIAQGVIKNLDQQLKELNKELGINTPNAADEARDALLLLEERLSTLQKYKEGNTFELFNFDAYKQSLVEILATTGVMESNITKNLEEQSDIRNKIIQFEKGQRIKAYEEELEAAQKAEISISDTLADLQIDADNRVSSNEKKSLNERTAALKDSFEQRKKIIQNDLNLQLSETINPRERAALQEKANADIIKAQRELNDNINQLNESSSQKTIDSEKAMLAIRIKNLQDFVDEGTILYKERFASAEDESKLEIKLSDLVLKEDLRNGKLRVLAELENSERINDINKRLLSNLLKIQQDIDKNPFPEPNIIAPKDTTKDDLQKQLAAAKKVNEELFKITDQAAKDRANVIATEQSKTNQELNDLYAEGLINAEQYEKDKRDNAIKYGKEATEAAIKIFEQQLIIAEQADPNSDKVRELTAQIAKLKEQLSELGVTIKDNGLKDLADQLQEIADVTANLTQAFLDLAGISFDNQKTNLEEIGAQEQKNYEQQQANIQNSTQSDEERANQLKILDSEHQARQEENARKQREYDNKKAEFDKAANVVNIITSTLAAAAKAGWITPVAIGIEIAGAAGLIKALATKVPHYKQGTHSAKEGYALTDEGGAELYIEPSGNTFLGNDKPTYRYLKAGTKVIPNDQVNEMIHKAMLINTGKVIYEPKEKKSASNEIVDAIKWQTKEMRKMQPKQRIMHGNKYSFAEAIYIAKNITHTS